MSFGAGRNAADLDWSDDIPLDEQEARLGWYAFGGLVALTVICYGNMLKFASSYWSNDLYSHGWIVPLIACYLFWERRRPLAETEPSQRWIGLAVVAVSLGVRLWASWDNVNFFDRLSFISVLLGICLMVGGTSLLKWAGPACGFLVFMFPLPYQVENTFLIKLLSWASWASTVILQTLGVGAVKIGQSIKIDSLEQPLIVAEACSGLRMLTVFGAMCVAMALLVDRPWWDRLAILVSAIPIALASNIIRIVATGLLYIAFPSAQQEGTLHTVIHDGAGYAMMVIGMGLLALELAILSRLTIPMEADDHFAAGAATA